VLAEKALPEDVAPVLQHHLWWATFLNGGYSTSSDGLQRLFELGVRWTQSSPDQIGNIRHSLLKTSDSVFVDLMKLLATADYCSPEILKELARTPSMRVRMKKVGFMLLHMMRRGASTRFDQRGHERSSRSLRSRYRNLLRFHFLNPSGLVIGSRTHEKSRWIVLNSSSACGRCRWRSSPKSGGSQALA